MNSDGFQRQVSDNKIPLRIKFSTIICIALSFNSCRVRKNDEKFKIPFFSYFRHRNFSSVARCGNRFANLILRGNTESTMTAGIDAKLAVTSLAAAATAAAATYFITKRQFENKATNERSKKVRVSTHVRNNSFKIRFPNSSLSHSPLFHRLLPNDSIKRTKKVV